MRLAFVILALTLSTCTVYRKPINDGTCAVKPGASALDSGKFTRLEETAP